MTLSSTELFLILRTTSTNPRGGIPYATRFGSREPLSRPHCNARLVAARGIRLRIETSLYRSLNFHDHLLLSIRTRSHHEVRRTFARSINRSRFI